MTVFTKFAEFFDTFFGGLNNIAFIGGISLLAWIEISFFASVMVGFIVRFIR